jgi:hypothetical protein
MAYHLLLHVADMQTDPILCPYCATPLRSRTPATQLRGAFECERAASSTDFRKTPATPPQSQVRAKQTQADA